MKTKALERFFAAHPKLALGFSGGVDSSFLLHFASQLSVDVAPYFVKTAFQPAFELEDARAVAEFSKATLRVIEVDVLDHPLVAYNGPDRCYHCKAAIFSRIREVAACEGCKVLIDGTNASDDAGDRPGMRALQELGVLSPLRLCELTKKDVRALSLEAGLFTHDKPAYSCLATRIRTGETITAARLAVIEAAERFLFSLGLGDLRVRTSGADATIQLPESQMAQLLAARREIVDEFASLGFGSVVLDLVPR